MVFNFSFSFQDIILPDNFLKKKKKNFFYQQINNIKNKCVMLIGSTGSGKTSFLELFINYLFFGYKFSKYKIYTKITNERQGLSPTDKNRLKMEDYNSSTLFSQIYALPLDDGNFFFILDTPGLNDTTGLEEDDKHIESIVSDLILLEKDNINISTILFFYNGADLKNKDNIQYVYNSFKIIFPKNSKINMVASRTLRKNETLIMHDTDTIPFENPYISFLETKICEREDIDYYELKIKSGQRTFNYINELINKNFIHITETKLILNNYLSYKEIKDNLKDIKDDYFILEELLNKLTYYEEEYTRLSKEIGKNQGNILELKLKLTDYQTNLIINNCMTVCTLCFKICHPNCELTPEKNLNTNYFLKCHAFIYNPLYIKGIQVCGFCRDEPEFHCHYKRDEECKKVIYRLELLIARQKNNNHSSSSVYEEFDNIYKRFIEIYNNSLFDKIISLTESHQKNSLVENMNNFIESKLKFIKNKYDKISDTHLKSKYKLMIDLFETYLNILNNKFNFKIIEKMDFNIKGKNVIN